MRSDAQRISDILKAIRKIEALHMLGDEEFSTNETVRDAMVLNFQVLGEAANGVSKELQASHPEVEWLAMINFRHVLIHRYWEIVMEEVWDGAKTFVPEQKPLIEAIAVGLASPKSD